MKYYIIAGEASGDLHGSNLMKALYKEDKDADVRFWGGDLMQAQGVLIKKHYRELAFMGFWEVLKNIRTIFSNIKLNAEAVYAIVSVPCKITKAPYSWKLRSMISPNTIQSCI